jgi:hypothetical protein
MQFSDLHKSISTYDNSKALVSSIVSDIARYAKEEISRPDMLIVCGDIVQGSVSQDDEIEKQYAEAHDFLNKLCQAVFNGDKNLVIIVPGNHDVSWPHSRRSMTKLERADQSIVKLLKEPRNYIRWNWEDFSCYRVADCDLYNQRFLPFSKFYSTFYDDKRKYSLKPEEQFDVFEFPDRKLLFVGFNSCFCNDHLNHIGMINPECMATCHSYISKEKYEGWAKVAIWHHGLHGVPTENDFMDERTMQFLIDKGFIIGLHGHQHKSDIFSVRFSADYSQKMLVFGCGTISAPKEELPLGETRQYNIIEVSHDYSRLRFHLRKGVDQPPGLHVWMPGNIRQNDDKSYIDIPIDRAIYGGKKKRVQVTAEQQQLLKKLAEAEELVAKKEYEIALDKLKSLSQDDPFVRRLTVECLFQLERDDDITQYIKEPATLTEFVYLCEALWRKKELAELRERVERHRRNSDIAESEQFKRIDSKLRDSGY